MQKYSLNMKNKQIFEKYLYFCSENHIRSDYMGLHKGLFQRMKKKRDITVNNKAKCV